MQARGIIFLSSFYLRTDWLKRRRTERKCSNPLANLGASRQGKCLFMPFTVCEHAQNCIVSSKATAMNWMSWPQARPSLYGFSSDFFFLFKLTDSVCWQASGQKYECMTRDFFLFWLAFAVVRSQVSFILSAAVPGKCWQQIAMTLIAVSNCTVGLHGTGGWFITATWQALVSLPSL